MIESETKMVTNAHPENVVSFARARPAWLGDIKLHARLMREYITTARLLKDIAGRMKRGTNEAKDELPYTVQARMAFRAAVTKALAKEKTLPSPSSALLQEYAHLSKGQKARLARILQLETRVLTAQPRTSAETRLLLKFISKLIASGRKIDKRYFADALDECALAISERANTTARPKKSSVRPQADPAASLHEMDEDGPTATTG